MLLLTSFRSPVLVRICSESKDYVPFDQNEIAIVSKVSKNIIGNFVVIDNWLKHCVVQNLKSGHCSNCSKKALKWSQKGFKRFIKDSKMVPKQIQKGSKVLKKGSKRVPK